MSTFRPGVELKIMEYPHFNRENADVSTLVKLSPDELKELEQASISEEQTIYAELQAVVGKWLKQAEKTIEYQKAQEYLNILPVPHTANRWETNKYGNHEISNMVYRFTWSEYDRTEWDRTAEKSVPVAWYLTWSVTFNTVHNPDNSGPGRQIAGQDRKYFKDRPSMEKYLQGRIAAYAHLFTEISPPIPEDDQRRFYVNGVLLPGYTVAVPELTRPEENDVEDLLSLLDDEDMLLSPPEEPEPPPVEFPRKHTTKKSKPQKSGPVR